MTSFITYAQNFEDVMLWRALHSVPDGFYIDVGAYDPDEDSVTRAFYDRGWRGINIEPAPSYFNDLLSARPRDITLQCLVGATQGEAELHHFGDTGLSTVNGAVAARHVAVGQKHEVIRLPVLPLAEIWRRHVDGTVHFLKIDVEGAEAEVLRGADLRLHRPWIVLAEATEPGSRTENWSEWEGFLTEADYRFAYFDGLNRYYISAERWDQLHGAFAAPPNVFDLWIRPRGKQQRALIEHGQAEAHAARISANAAHEAMAAMHAKLTAAQAEAERAIAAETELAVLREQQQVQQRHIADFRRRIIAAKASHLEARAEAERLRAELVAESGRRAAELAQWQAEAERFRAALEQARQERERSETELRKIKRNIFWRATAPLRGLVIFFRGLVRPAKRMSTEHPASMSTAVGAPPAQTLEAQGDGGEHDAAAPIEEWRMQARLRAWARSG